MVSRRFGGYSFVILCFCNCKFSFICSIQSTNLQSSTWYNFAVFQATNFIRPRLIRHLIDCEHNGNVIIHKFNNKVLISVVFILNIHFFSLTKPETTLYFERTKLFVLFTFVWALLSCKHSIHTRTVHPIDLHLIFEKSSLKNQVCQTGFFVYFKLDFWRLQRQ